jgi:hypothetical protein
VSFRDVMLALFGVEKPKSVEITEPLSQPSDQGTAGTLNQGTDRSLNQVDNIILKPAPSADACPHCGYGGPRGMLPNGSRCQQCGAQFEKSQHIGVNRGNYLEGKVALRALVFDPAPFQAARARLFLKR